MVEETPKPQAVAPVAKKCDPKMFGIVIAVILVALIAVVLMMRGGVEEEKTPWAPIERIQCVSSPLNELITSVQDSMTGLTVTTETICLMEGESFDSDSITSKISGVNSVTFICSPQGCPSQLQIGATDVAATGDVKFKAMVECDELAGNYGKFDCLIQIRNA